mmetsp:Transcript_13516/g.39900  ORF Transcript_13516/g.39900 Transcript_13516/m.39900 type:complete len:507 (-) Transcript_13516:11-1531(-)
MATLRMDDDDAIEDDDMAPATAELLVQNRDGRTLFMVPLVSAKSEWTIGNDDSCDIVIKEQGISARHARLNALGRHFFTLTDLKSTNGSRLAGIPLQANVPSAFADGASAFLAHVKLVLQVRAGQADDMDAAAPGTPKIPGTPVVGTPPLSADKTEPPNECDAGRGDAEPATGSPVLDAQSPNAAANDGETGSGWPAPTDGSPLLGADPSEEYPQDEYQEQDLPEPMETQVEGPAGVGKEPDGEGPEGEGSGAGAGPEAGVASSDHESDCSLDTQPPALVSPERPARPSQVAAQTAAEGPPQGAQDPSGSADWRLANTPDMQAQEGVDAGAGATLEATGGAGGDHDATQAFDPAATPGGVAGSDPNTTQPFHAVRGERGPGGDRDATQAFDDGEEGRGGDGASGDPNATQVLEAEGADAGAGGDPDATQVFDAGEDGDDDGLSSPEYGVEPAAPGALAGPAPAAGDEEGPTTAAAEQLQDRELAGGGDDGDDLDQDEPGAAGAAAV